MKGKEIIKFLIVAGLMVLGFMAALLLWGCAGNWTGKKGTNGTSGNGAQTSLGPKVAKAHAASGTLMGEQKQGPGGQASNSRSAEWPPAVPLPMAGERRADTIDKESVYLPWVYPNGPITSTNFNLQGATDLVHWVTLRTNLPGGDVWVTNTGGNWFYRIECVRNPGLK